jgi:hypothetical protein
MNPPIYNEYEYINFLIASPISVLNVLARHLVGTLCNDSECMAIESRPASTLYAEFQTKTIISRPEDILTTEEAELI